MSGKLEQGLSGLAHVEDADERGVLGEGGEEMLVVRRS